MSKLSTVEFASTAQEIIEDRAVYRVWEKVADMDLSRLYRHDSWLVNGSYKLRKALDKAVKSDNFDGFKAILRDAGLGERPSSVGLFWSELEAIASAAVSTVWSEYADQFATLSESDRINLRKKLNWQARHQAIHLVEEYRFPAEE
jgi:hypothetical protein